jgi:hypothetical protein
MSSLRMRVTIDREEGSTYKPYHVWTSLEEGDPTDGRESFILGSFDTFDGAVAAILAIQGIEIIGGIRTQVLIVSEHACRPACDPPIQTC